MSVGSENVLVELGLDVWLCRLMDILGKSMKTLLQQSILLKINTQMRFLDFSLVYKLVLNENS